MGCALFLSLLNKLLSFWRFVSVMGEKRRGQNRVVCSLPVRELCVNEQCMIKGIEQKKKRTTGLWILAECNCSPLSFFTCSIVVLWKKVQTFSKNYSKKVPFFSKKKKRKRSGFYFKTFCIVTVNSSICEVFFPFILLVFHTLWLYFFF